MGKLRLSHSKMLPCANVKRTVDFSSQYFCIQPDPFFLPFNQLFTVRQRLYLTTARSLVKVRGHNYSSTSVTAVFKEKSSPFRKNQHSMETLVEAGSRLTDNNMLALPLIEDHPCLHKHASFCTNILVQF